MWWVNLLVADLFLFRFSRLFQLALFPMSEEQQYLMRKNAKAYPTTATSVNSSATLTPTTTPLNSNANTADGGGGGTAGKTIVPTSASSLQYLIPGKGPNIMISTPTTLINGAFQQFSSE